ncbi:uncharacterized protein PG998_009359 [Apiospora kogelbergensis]|uniref:Uncharacterized protein n=1 Tax=Apiospora kogelbergensis TaxID=1337665 RepID=A0AAW0R7P7_9PEZI
MPENTLMRGVQAGWQADSTGKVKLPPTTGTHVNAIPSSYKCLDSMKQDIAGRFRGVDVWSDLTSNDDHRDH